MTGLQFDAERHLYTLGGVVLPSVTQIMRPLSMIHYNGIDEAVMRRAAERGTAVHEACELFNKYGANDCPADLGGYFDAYLNWFYTHNPRVLHSELATYHPALMYAGTADIVAEIGGKVFLIDIKTTATIADALTVVQLTAYKHALEAHGIHIDEVAILQLRPDGHHVFRQYPAECEPEAWATFAALLTVRAHLKKYGK